VNWLFELHKTQPVAHAVGVLAFVCVVGMALASVKVKGIGLGTAGVLFAGILVGHFGKAVDHHTLDFVKEFGLILFVFTIGLQLGPGFLAALQQQGVKLNMLAAAIVLLGAAGAPLAGWLAGFDAAAVLGIFSGASTNTPSLGAGTQTLSTLPDIAPDRLTLPALAYAVTYPMAIVGIIGTLLVIKQVFRVDPVHEAADFVAKNRSQAEPLERHTLVVTNPNLDGVRLKEIPGRIESGVTISRVRHAGETRAATDATVIHCDDRLAVVGNRAGLDQFERAIGQRCDEDLVLPESNITFRRVIVTSRDVLGKTVGELDLGERFGVAVTRVTRAGLSAGAKFFTTVFSATGLQWLLAGVCVTVLPLLLVGVFARVALKMNFMDLSGLLAGSMTDPPALAFASNVANSDAPTVAYATVYPLTTLLRILSAQVLAIALFR
jgi:putative transport protein